MSFDFNLCEAYLPPLRPEEVLQAAEDGDWDLVNDALLGLSFESTFLSADDEEELLSVIEGSRNWEALGDLVVCNYLFDMTRIEDIVLQALYDKCYSFVVRMVLEVKLGLSNNVLVAILEKFLEEDDLLLEAKRLICLISNEDMDWLQHLWESAAQRPTRNSPLMQEVLKALHKHMYTGTTL